VDRINQIGRTAQNIIETGDLSQRISLDSRWDDLSNLAFILNELLAQIEKLMLDVRQVSDNIAHDLRTPLARLRSNLEALEKSAEQRNDEDSLDQIEVLKGEADHLLATFNALLRIANIESGKRQMPRAAVDMQALIEDVEDLYRPLAEEKNILFNVNAMPAVCDGDQNLIFQMVANLVDNAVKFTPENGTIDLVVKPDSGMVLISVCDSGPGIPEGDRGNVFTRFFRADQSRNTRGNGLGLSLVAAVVDRHMGTITLSDNDPGLRADVRLP
jgi:signal transduction histidine kinase